VTNPRFPSDPLRGALADLGVPRDQHDVEALARMLPVHVAGKPLEELSADAIAETLVYLIGKGVMRPPSTERPETPGEWGRHLCQLYHSRDDLLELVVPHFREGLRAGEYCIWVLPPELTPAAARDTLERVMPDFGEHEENLEVHRHDRWYLDDAGRMRSPIALLEQWAAKDRWAREKGYPGIRVAGDTAWIERAEDWSGFMAYEARVQHVLRALRVKAICTYPIRRRNPGELAEIGVCHGSVVLKKDRWWHRIDATRRKEAEAVLVALASSVVAP